jgi:hypothetical protein
MHLRFVVKKREEEKKEEEGEKEKKKPEALKTDVVINVVQNMRKNGNECDKNRRYYYRHCRRRTRTVVEDHRRFRAKHSYAHDRGKK